MATQNNKKKKLILIGLGTAVAGILGYFGWQYFSNRNSNTEMQDDFPLPSPQADDFSPNNIIARNDEFPLKRGSKGQRVQAVQEALIAKYGKSILPKYGSDGDFGSETVAALKKAGLPESIDEATYNSITKSEKSSSSTTEAASLAKTLYKAAVNKNLLQVITALRQMKTKDDYSSVSNEFLQYRIGGVRKTLVNGMLDSFSDEGQKQQIRMEFSRMGLKYDGDKWSLSGIGGMTVITRRNASVWRNPYDKVEVPARTILGTEIGQLNGFTAFENNGETFLINTQNIENL
ncbi:MAG TPA: hypothetical protein DDX39_12095 [Bacteroidales bacterium]|nr:MAG: hypothetical protein A2W98_11500 [Bacteroidetes bacterium GWF2_33_38]OFY74860.1 MAG: hypothetical protein A2265_04075 [Bacteroidetes bacterium RIFOXYA12_FULL_33_9]OFY92066.1 MAG: hypothetical protein A2236_08910 [Bacteroidetes bacterium RIFOXYA2_FULL_33_7]HBF89373.1 hypothetical protein [Bacteroidales bacterium]